MDGHVPRKVLFGHTPKAAGSHITEYFRRQLRYPVIQSDEKFENGVWHDFTLNQVLQSVHAEHAFLCSHVLAFGWSGLVKLVPFVEEQKIVDAIQTFRSRGWFAFTFVRHPGELLTSFYYYIVDAHERGWHDSVALHTPAVGRTLEAFVSEHCEELLLPEYWREYDYANEANDENLCTFFARNFDHEYQPGATDRHASGSRGYAYYCETGEISKETQARIECSRNMEIYREILASNE